MSSSKDTPENGPRKGSAKVQVVNESVGTSESMSLSVAVAEAWRPLPQDHPFYAQIGRVTAEWAQLEHRLDLIIWKLSGIDKKLGSCLTGHIVGHGQRFGMLMSLAAAAGFDQSTLKKIELLGQKTTEVSKRRNRLVHDAWYVEAGGQVGQFKSFTMKQRDFGIVDIDENDVSETIELIRRRLSDILQLSAVLHAKP